MRRLPTVALALAVTATSLAAEAPKRYPVTALVLSVDAPKKTFIASNQEIPGYMEAMVMPFSVKEAAELDGLAPGTIAEFTLVVSDQDSFVEGLRPRAYRNAEQEPMLLERLRLLESLKAEGVAPPPRLAVGDAVPDFALVDQDEAGVRLSQFEGKLVALTFIYTTCPLPNYCLRLSNNFGRLQERFRDRMGEDLVLLSVTFDPLRDQPRVLAEYAKRWAGDKRGWHFLTGPVDEVKRVARSFGQNFWPDEGKVTHGLHTFVIGRDGRLVADLEGNEFTSQQLGDFLEAQLAAPAPR